MRLTFPFSNLVANTLNGFLEREFVETFVEFKSGLSFLPDDFLDDPEQYKSFLPALENEVLQVIETTNQETIDKYFKLALERASSSIDNFSDSSIKESYLDVDKEGKYLKDFYDFAKSQLEKYRSVIDPYIEKYQAGEIKSKFKENQVLKPILFVEGNHDIKYIEHAAALLGRQEFLKNLDIRQRGGYSNLDKLWDVLKVDSWETTPQVKIFLYDCDVKRKDEDFGVMFKRTMPIQTGRRIGKGIENLFPDKLIEKGEQFKADFIDFETHSGRTRGKVYKNEICKINEDEKTSFCDWVCKNGTKDDFRGFEEIFSTIDAILK